MYEIQRSDVSEGWEWVWRLTRDGRDVAFFRHEADARACCAALNERGVRYPDDDQGEDAEADS